MGEVPSEIFRIRDQCKLIKNPQQINYVGKWLHMEISGHTHRLDEQNAGLVYSRVEAEGNTALI